MQRLRDLIYFVIVTFLVCSFKSIPGQQIQNQLALARCYQGTAAAELRTEGKSDISNLLKCPEPPSTYECLCLESSFLEEYIVCEMRAMRPHHRCKCSCCSQESCQCLGIQPACQSCCSPAFPVAVCRWERSQESVKWWSTLTQALSNVSCPPTECIKAKGKIPVIRLLFQRAKNTIHQAGFVGQHEGF